MNCEQFQRVLPQIIEGGGTAEEEAHLRSCDACSELVRDLKYIAEQAKLLLPLHDPNPRVWNNIQESLAHEGLIPRGRMTLVKQTTKTPSKKKNWRPPGIVLAALAVLLLGALLLSYRSVPGSPKAIAPVVAAENNTGFDTDDQALLQQLAHQPPEVGKAYETSLREANSYIADAKQAVLNNPADPAAQEQLKDAYENKAMIYGMATTRALE